MPRAEIKDFRMKRQQFFLAFFDMVGNEPKLRATVNAFFLAIFQ
jgi:hypothetical protein